jgi:hypothetical protein
VVSETVAEKGLGQPGGRRIYKNRRRSRSGCEVGVAIFANPAA